MSGDTLAGRVAGRVAGAVAGREAAGGADSTVARTDSDVAPSSNKHGIRQCIEKAPPRYVISVTEAPPVVSRDVWRARSATL